jgi:hypothetical protein
MKKFRKKNKNNRSKPHTAPGPTHFHPFEKKEIKRFSEGIRMIKNAKSSKII